MSHTPGPWNLHTYEGYSEVNHLEINANGAFGTICSLSDSNGSSKANASLISAAPEMLEALQNLLPMWESGIDEPWITKAREAIIKATGQDGRKIK